MKKVYIAPKSEAARINGKINLLKDMSLIGGSKTGENQGVKERVDFDDASGDDFWSTGSSK